MISPAVVVGVVGGAGVVALAWAAGRAGPRARVGRLRPPRRPRLLPRTWEASLRARLDEAAVGMEPGSFVRCWLGAAAAVSVVGAGASPVVGLLGGVVALLAGPAAVGLARARAERARAAELPEMLERVASELRAGNAVVSAVGSLGGSPGPLHHDFVVVRRSMERGASLVDALAAWAHRSRVEGVREAAGGLAVVSRMGGAAAPALDGLAASLRDRLAAGAEGRAQSSQARMSALVVGGAPLAYLAFASVADPGSVSLLVTTPVGRLCLAAGLALEAAGAAWMRRIVTGAGS